MTYAFDKASRLTTVTDWASRVTGYEYHPDGALEQQTNVNGTVAAHAAALPEERGDARGLAQHNSSRPTDTLKRGYTLSETQNARLLLVDGSGNLGHLWEWEPFGRAFARSTDSGSAIHHDEGPHTRAKVSTMALIPSRRHNVPAATMLASSPAGSATASTLCPVVI